MNKFDLWLGRANISNNIKIDLIKKFNTTENLWYHVVSKYDNIYNENTTNKLRAAWNEQEVQDVLRVIKNKGIKYTIYNDESYPEKLKNYMDSPFIIFYYGDLSPLSETYNAAIVGSRHCTNYGINTTQIITRDLSFNNINIISGMARGIDSEAHRTSIENNNFTCAVLGCGIDIIYPKENAELYNKIMNSGCIISEFLPGVKPLSYNFPKRNRIISALSDIVIIVEAGFKSGSLITASTAAEQGVDVISVPGSVFSEQSRGTNRLIRDGAYPFTEMKDIYNLLGIFNPAVMEQKKVTSNENEGNIIRFIGNTPVHIDDLIRSTNIDIKQLYEVLFEMQLKDEIMCIAGNYYAKINKEI